MKIFDYTPEEVEEERKNKVFGRKLLDHEGSAMIRVKSGETSPGAARDRYYLAQHAHVHEVLCTPDKFPSDHYDDLMVSLKTPIRMFPGADDAVRKKRRQLLNDALDVQLKELKDMKELKKTDTTSAVWTAKIAKRKANLVLEAVRKDVGQNGQFNMVREYAFLVPYLTMIEILGLKLPVKTDLPTRALFFFRNLFIRNPEVKVRGIQSESLSLLIWSQFFSAHLFGNYEGKSWWLRKLGSYGLGRLVRHLDPWLMDTGAAPRGSLFSAIQIVLRDGQSDDPITANDLMSIFVELLTTSVVLPGTAFCQSADELFRKNSGAQVPVYYDTFVEDISYPGVEDDQRKAAFDELFRLFPVTPSLERTAAKDADLDGYTFNVGDSLTLLLKLAARDPNEFGKCPGKYAPDPERRYLEFRPEHSSSDPRRCFGRDWSLTMIGEMLVALNGPHRTRPVADSDGELAEIGPIPDRMMFEFTE